MLSSAEGAYEPQTKAAQLGSTPTDTTDHSPRLQERGDDYPWGFILGCEEGAGQDLGALVQ